MTPYVQREIFRAFEQVVFARAKRLVVAVGSHWGNELRCHELARAVHSVLDIGSARVVDGTLGIVEHSWIEIVVPVADFERERVGRVRECTCGLGVRMPPAHDPTCEVRVGDGIGRGYNRKVILDVYCPGRLPQVQLIDSFVLLTPRYDECEPRTDIRADIVARLVGEMRSPS